MAPVGSGPLAEHQAMPPCRAAALDFGNLNHAVFCVFGLTKVTAVSVEKTCRKSSSPRTVRFWALAFRYGQLFRVVRTAPGAATQTKVLWVEAYLTGEKHVENLFGGEVVGIAFGVFGRLWL